MNSKSIYTRLYALASGILLTFFFQTASAQQSVKPLSLNEAISLSIQNSKQLKVSHAKVDQATASLKEANERQLPDVSVSGSYLRLTQPNIDMKLKLGDDSNGGTKSESPKVNSAAYGIASVSVPIFAGGLIQSGKESARYLAEAARLDVDKDREDVIQNTIAAYSNLYKAKAAVALVQENIRQSDERVKEFSNKEKNGLLARNDLLKAELQQSNYQLALMDAENNLKIANLNMDIMLGLPDNTMIQVDSTVFKVDDKVDGRGVAEFEQLAYQNRKDAASLTAREKAANAGIKGAKADYFPSLAVTGGYVAAYIPNVITITNAVNAGVGLKYNLSSLWKTGSKVSNAKAQLAEVQANEAKLVDGIHLDVYQSYENYLLSHKKMDTYIKAIEQSEENYRITKNKHDNNLATTTDLLDADVANLQAHLNYAYAKADALVAYNKLLQSAGILESNNK
ncbi:Outer membrane protein TolC [Chitinophaga ginsengisegetis]|uniref:Outer membrane protein TolC n=1 Tax=Chitinophaga ginsengisegetis TaxID=393003 RepID=A0A1T5PBI0_9BACT|nr:TolC family protein [Chitinophaga ginsengisegetis]MDR6568859.1 outer membrane protein TolC [Chitinophaga ginsengisegetis]MDR6649111.1 outer membrane protein TolC [Chitinophaga ginsengisegetis]MDR6654940.1 outer membrane protein TolC [Chitinophaga ginsengisegetis]SKD09609.1 Outer membrane protein TolC [Chitinophaga ginsengisegetis]